MRTRRTLFHYFFVLRERTLEVFSKRSPPSSIPDYLDSYTEYLYDACA